MNSVRKQYCEFLNTEHGASAYNAFKRYLYGDQDSLIQVLNNDVLQDLGVLRNEQLDVCDIGGGDGKRISHILSFLNSKFGVRFELDLIEQSKVLIDRFEPSLIQSFCHTTKINELFEDVVLAKQFDLIFLVHSIFALNNGATIQKIFSLKSPNGRIIVLSNAPDSFLAGLKSIADGNYPDKRYEIDNLKDSLTNLGIDFFIRHSQTKWAIKRLGYDKFASVLLEWITLGQYQSFSKDKKHKLIDYLERNSDESGGRYFFSEKEEILVIPSACSAELEN